MKKALLFGSSGFLGRHVKEVLSQDMAVSCPTRAECNLLDDEAAVIAGIIRATKPDVVINCTGALDGSGYDLLRANALVTAKLIDSIASSARGIRLIRVGSASEYGRIPFGESVRESATPMPLSEYGLSHLTASRLVEWSSAEGVIDGVVLRVFNPIGPGLSTDSLLGRSASLMIEALLNRTDRVVLGKLDAYRDFVDVRDVAHAVRAACEVATLRERVFNVGTGLAVRTGDAVRQLATIAGYDGDIVENQSVVQRRSRDVPWVKADISTAAEILGWQPHIDLSHSLSALWIAATSGNSDLPKYVPK